MATRSAVFALATAFRLASVDSVGSVFFAQPTHYGYVASNQGPADGDSAAYCGGDCDSTLFYESQSAFGFGHGHRLAQLQYFDLPRTYSGNDLQRVTHVGLSCHEVVDTAYQGRAYIAPLLKNVGAASGKWDATWETVFGPDASTVPLESVVGPAVGLVVKDDDTDSLDFSDQYQLRRLFEDWMNGARPNHGWLMYPEPSTELGSSIDEYACTLAITHEPQDKSRDKCFAYGMATVSLSEDVDRYSSGGAAYLSLVNTAGVASAEVRVPGRYKNGDTVAELVDFECGLVSRAPCRCRRGVAPSTTPPCPAPPRSPPTNRARSRRSRSATKAPTPCAST